MLPNTSSDVAEASPEPRGIDGIDRRILAILQEDATVPITEIAFRVGVSQTPCWRRIQRLEREGIIRGRVAVVDPARVGLPLTALVFVQSPDHSPVWLRAFADFVAATPEIVEAHRLAGDIDYVLRVVARDMEAYDRVYTRLIEAVPVKSVTSRFAIESLRTRGPIPL